MGSKRVRRTFFAGLIGAAVAAGWLSAPAAAGPAEPAAPTVTADEPLLAGWRLDEAGGAASLADTTGNGHTATMQRGTLGVPGRLPGGATVARFDGKPGSGAAADPVLDTSTSFSVAAWVRLTDTHTWHTAVSQDGAHTAGFQLQYAANCACWRFRVPSGDRVGSGFRAVRAGRSAAGVWTHLVGVYDKEAAALRIYVDGRLAGTAGAPATPWKATGPLTIGRSRWNDRTDDFWSGDMANVKVWNRVLRDTEVTELTDPFRVGRVGEWHMGEVGFGPAFDSSNFGRDLTFFGEAEIPPSSAGRIGTGLRLDGTSAYASTSEPVVNTDQSFTAAAWVRLKDGSGARTVLAEQGTSEDAFALRYADGRWGFEARTADAATATTVRAASPSPAPLNSYVHLVGVYDATAKKILLYVDGQLTASAPFVRAWNATGPLILGRGTHSGAPADFWSGDLDEVHVFAGVVTDVTRIP